MDAHQRGDFATVFAAYDPAIEWRTGDARTAQWSDFEPVYHGHEGVRTFWRTWFAAWETVYFEYEEFIDAGDQVLSILSQRMRGRTSGVELEWNSYAQVWTIRDGKVIACSSLRTGTRPSKPPGSRSRRYGRPRVDSPVHADIGSI